VYSHIQNRSERRLPPTREEELEILEKWKAKIEEWKTKMDKKNRQNGAENRGIKERGMNCEVR
jgi:vacuolar-type H+-ATPase subunit H